MPHHRALGLALDQLDIIVVDDAKPMQQILRSILLNVHVARVRAFDRPEEALQAMMVEPPNLLITDWNMKPTDGLALLRAMRRKRMGAVAFVPAILVTAHPTRQLVESALASGAHSVIAKPIAPATLINRIMAVAADQREFVLGEDGASYHIAGYEKLVAAERERWKTMMGSRAAHVARLKAAKAAEEAEQASPQAAQPAASEDEKPHAEAAPRTGGEVAADIRNRIEAHKAAGTGKPAPKVPAARSAPGKAPVAPVAVVAAAQSVAHSAAKPGAPKAAAKQAPFARLKSGAAAGQGDAKGA